MRYNIYIAADGDVLVYSINTSNESSAIAEAVSKTRDEGYKNIVVTKCIKNDKE